MLKLQAIGHIGQDAIVNVVNGKNVINFSVAHSEKYKNAGGIEMQKTTWVSCNYWTDKTGVAQYLKRGVQVFVEGQPDVKMYEDKNRQQQAELKLRVVQIQLLGSRDKPESGSAPAQNNIPAAEDITEPISDLPF